MLGRIAALSTGMKNFGFFFWLQGCLIRFAYNRSMSALTDGWCWLEEVLLALALEVCLYLGKMFVNEFIDRKLTS
uniref:hypothetical protein n=1 Tax=Arthrobacter sp. TaxID=1667 RepID=UPI00159EBF2E|nr:hypothetical protein [Arthrobacter sp.]